MSKGFSPGAYQVRVLVGVIQEVRPELLSIMVYNRSRDSGQLDKDANGETDWDVSNCCVTCANLTNLLAGLTITMKQFV